MSRGSASKLCRNFRVTFLNAKLQRLWTGNHSQYIISSKHSESLETSLRQSDTVGKVSAGYLRSFGGIKASSTKTSSEIRLQCEQSLNFHRRMQFKALSLKGEALCERDPEILLSSLGSFKMDWCKVASCCVVRLNTLRNYFRQTWMPRFKSKEKRGHLACYQWSGFRAEEPASHLMVCRWELVPTELATCPSWKASIMLKTIHRF